MVDLKDKVIMWEEDVEIPTYPAGKPDKNPMFLEKRVYQGSSGKVYPLPVIEKISDKKTTEKYHIVFLENEYLQVWVMPELGGRIQRALDKTNGYDFVYYNHVIKLALVGLAGPWISGGIEFNWPQHHRPSTFSPVDYILQENTDGSKTVWISETDRMYGTKGIAGFTLYPGKAYIEVKAQLYNRTAIPQTFLWWANPAVSVNQDTQSVFPPDVHAVYDHGKRDVSKFPIATGTYYKVDYSRGVDISRYKNIPVPTSYMAYRSDFNFVGGYDHGREAGLLHVADHHVSPGKKQWTWGCGDFGQAWDRNLTDEDGPYVELMTGVFTDNQPDFTWLEPYEEKTFTQYFMPYKNIGAVKNAAIEAAVNLDVEDGKVVAAVYATSVYEGARIILKGKSGIYMDETRRLSPVDTFRKQITLSDGDSAADLELTVTDRQGIVLVSYKPVESVDEEVPEPAKAIPSPQEIECNEALYLAGLHLEQYRHATYAPEAYYREGLRRSPGDIRINNAYGALLFRRGQFKESEAYFRKAIETATRHNPNPYNSEMYYNLGLSMKMQGRLDEAYDAFYKACWNAAMQDAGYFSLAQIASARGEFNLALEHIEKSLSRNTRNYKARLLKASLLRKTKALEKARSFAEETLKKDITDFGARNELYLITRESENPQMAGLLSAELDRLMRGSEHNYIELSIDYASCGLYEEAIDVLRRMIDFGGADRVFSPMVYYYLGWYYVNLGDADAARGYYEEGALAPPDYCFPNRLEDIIVLQDVNRRNPSDAKAFYYLGNLWYDRKQYNEAIDCWERSSMLDESFPTARRNLSLACYNKLNDPVKARSYLEKAFELDRSDARVFLELDQLYKRLGIKPEVRIEKFEQHFGLVEDRDDLYVEYITLLNLTGQYEKALTLTLGRKFHPWEGGEGKITGQYVHSIIEKGKKLLADSRYQEAVEILTKAFSYPHSLGEGKLAGAQENNLNYYLGCAFEALNDTVKAKEHFEKASVGLDIPASAMFYNDQPPEMIFYQGMALLKLGLNERAAEKFNILVNYGTEHMNDHITIDYFAVSLPDLLIFDDDLDRRNVIHCLYLVGLGLLGMNRFEEARREFVKALELDENHLGLRTHIKLIEQRHSLPPTLFKRHA